MVYHPKREDAMKKIYLMLCISISISIIIIILSLCSNTHTYKTSNNQIDEIKINQEFLNQKKIIDKVANGTKISKDRIKYKNIWIQYVDIDEDPELELLISYRVEVHKGYFFIYDYKERKYFKIFSKEWAIERMSANDVIVASGNDEIHQLTAFIIHMHQRKVNILWYGIIDKYNYSDTSKGREIHAKYYVDTNSVLHYCYKIEATDTNAKVLEREFREDLYVWSNLEGKYIRNNKIYNHID